MTDRENKPSLLRVLPWLILSGLLLRVGLGQLGVVILLALLPVTLLGLAAAFAICGPRGALAAARYLVGRARESEVPLAARALGAAGAFVIHVGVLACFAALVAHLDLIRGAWEALREHGQPSGINPADIAELLRYGVLLGVPATLFAGRFVLGAAGESAARRAGIAAPRFAAATQVAAALVVPLYFSTFFLTFSTIAR